MFNVTNKPKEIGTICVLYGEPGIGKSTIAGNFAKKAGEKGIIIPCVEDGVSVLTKDDMFDSLKGVNMLDTPVQKWRDDKNGGLIEALMWLNKQDYEVIVFDSISMIMDELEEYCFKKYFLDQPEVHGRDMNEDKLRNLAYGFGKSNLIMYMAKEWQLFTKAVAKFRDKGIKVFITSHTMDKKKRLVGDELEFDVADLSMPKTKSDNLSDMLLKISDFFLYGKRDITVMKGKKANTVTGGKERILVGESDGYITAKKRSTMPDEIPATYSELKKYIN